VPPLLIIPIVVSTPVTELLHKGRCIGLIVGLAVLLCSSHGRTQEFQVSGGALCGADEPNIPHVLVGPFAITGELERPTDKILGSIVPLAVAGPLQSASNLAVFVWNGGAPGLEGRQFVELGNILGQPILYGSTPDPKKDVQGYRLIKNLARLLRDQNCSHLVGGHIVVTSGFFTVYPYLLSSSDDTLSRPFGSAGQSIRKSAVRLSEEIGVQLVRHLAQPRRALGTIEVGCLSSAQSRQQGGDTLDIAESVQHATTSALTRDDHLLGRIIFSKNALCTGAEAARIDNATVAIISGEISSSDSGLNLRPFVRFLRRGDEASDSVPVNLALVSGPWNSSSQLARDFADEVKTFFDIIVGHDGTILPLTNLGTPISRDDLLRAVTSLSYADTFQAPSDDLLTDILILGYKGVSQRSDDRLALFLLGRALLRRSNFSGAAYYLAKAAGEPMQGPLEGDKRANQRGPNNQVTASEELPANLVAELYESLGEALHAMGEYDASKTSLQRAVQSYEEQGRAADRQRTVNRLASGLLGQGDAEGARNAIIAYGDAPRDYETLYLRGKIEFVSNNLDAAAEWFNRAVNASPSDTRALSGLAETYEVRGIRAASSNNFLEADKFFQLALQKAPSARLNYVAGVSAQTAGEFSKAANYFNAVVDAYLNRGMELSDGRHGRAIADINGTKWVESSLANLLECLLLTDRFDRLETLGGLADGILSRPGLVDSQLLTLYLRLSARVLQRPEPISAEWIRSDPLYQASIRLVKEQGASLSKLRWSNSAVVKFFDKASPEKARILEEVVPDFFSDQQ
jgi:tetratricopeptide (TPR) repeat protein